MNDIKTQIQQHLSELMSRVSSIPDDELENLDFHIISILDGTNAKLNKEVVDCLFLGFTMKNIVAVENKEN